MYSIIDTGTLGAERSTMSRNLLGWCGFGMSPIRCAWTPVGDGTVTSLPAATLSCDHLVNHLALCEGRLHIGRNRLERACGAEAHPESIPYAPCQEGHRTLVWVVPQGMEPKHPDEGSLTLLAMTVGHLSPNELWLPVGASHWCSSTARVGSPLLLVDREEGVR